MKFLFFFLSTLCALSLANAQDTKPVALKQEHVSYAPKGFYISDVVDDRADKVIGMVTGDGRREKLVMPNGAAAAIKDFIARNVTQDKTRQPIVMHITAVDMDVQKAGASYKIETAMTTTFYAAGNKVVEYSGKGHAQTDEDPADYIEGFMRQTMEGQLKRFDSWWAQNGSQVPTQSAVKVNVTIGRQSDKPHCIVYSLQRPLSIADFTGPAEGQIEELAATFSGIGMGYGTETKNGQVIVNVTVTPYFDEAQSWFKEAGKNPRVLAHEQAHFDVTAIKACELADAIRKTAFTQDNYSQLLTKMQNQNAADANEEEKLYDAETNHGIIEDKQISWQNKLKEQVRAIGCY